MMKSWIASFGVLVMLLASFCLLMLINWLQRKGQTDG